MINNHCCKCFFYSFINVITSLRLSWSYQLCMILNALYFALYEGTTEQATLKEHRKCYFSLPHCCTRIQNVLHDIILCENEGWVKIEDKEILGYRKNIARGTYRNTRKTEKTTKSHQVIYCSRHKIVGPW